MSYRCKCRSPYCPVRNNAGARQLYPINDNGLGTAMATRTNICTCKGGDSIYTSYQLKLHDVAPTKSRTKTMFLGFKATGQDVAR